jgi:hypothetical protein
MLIANLKKKIKNFLVHVIETALTKMWMKREPFDVERMAYILATVEAAKFFKTSMSMTSNLVTQQGLLDYAIKKVSVGGLWMEFGVFTGTSIRKIATRIFGFDSFWGLPEDWTNFQKKGRFSLKGSMPTNLPSNVKLVKGWFSETLPEFLKKHKEPVGFLHIDCDLYSSTNMVLTHLRNRIKKGTIIVFDEFFNFPNWQEHEYKAFMEFIEKNQYEYEFLGFASSHFSVAIRITKTGQQSTEHEQHSTYCIETGKLSVDITAIKEQFQTEGN